MRGGRARRRRFSFRADCGRAAYRRLSRCNVAANLQRLGVKTGFGFLERPAGFDISQTLITLSAKHATYMSAFVVALLNTLLVTALSIMLATVLGFVIGMARCSSNGLVRRRPARSTSKHSATSRC